MQQVKNDLSSFTGEGAGDVGQLAKAARADFERARVDQVDVFYAHQEKQRMEEHILRARYNYQLGYTHLMAAAGRLVSIQHPDSQTEP